MTTARVPRRRAIWDDQGLGQTTGVQVKYSNMIRDLIDDAGDMPGRGAYEPGPGMPVCSTTTIPGVSTDHYDAFENVVGITHSLPDGWEVRLALANDRRITSFAVWSTLERGRDFFAKVVAVRLPELVAMGVPMRDFVRHEYRLATLRTGARAGELVEGGPGVPEGAGGYVLNVAAKLDSKQGHTMTAAFEHYARIASSPEVEAEFAGGLMLVVGGVTARGMVMGWLHADPSAGSKLLCETIPRLAADALPGWPPLEYEVEEFRAYRATVKAGVLA